MPIASKKKLTTPNLVFIGIQIWSQWIQDLVRDYSVQIQTSQSAKYVPLRPIPKGLIMLWGLNELTIPDMA